MPFINSKVNVKILPEQEIQLKMKLGKAIELIPGKNESWLMLSFEDECTLYFKGENSCKIAYVEVKVFGSENKAAFKLMTAAICQIYEEVLGIAPDKIYVKYEAVTNWGWNGMNF